MKIKFNDMVIYKKDKNEGGLLFSISDASSTILRVTGLVDVIAEKIYQGQTMEEIRSYIHSEFDVTDQKLDADLNDFKAKLKELNYLKDE